MEKQVLFFGACYYSGLISLRRWWIQRSGQRLIILNYHRASGGDLRRHLLYLRRHYRILHLEEALEELYAADKQGKQMRDRRRTPLVLTFDDGYRDNYTHGFPLACELHVPITIFLIATYIDGDRCFWWLEGDLLVSHAQVNEVMIEGCTYHLNQQEARTALVEAIYTRTCHARSVAEREAFLGEVREALAAPSAATTCGEAVLKWAEIREMEQSGWVSFGAHTMHHPVLAYLANPAEVQCEVSECRTVIERQLGHPMHSFAYPLGRPEHIGEEALRAVREAGYKWAVTTSYGINTPQSDPLQLLRITGNVRRHWLLLAADISSVRPFFSPLFPYGRALWSVGKGIVTLSLRLLTSGYRKLRGRR